MPETGLYKQSLHMVLVDENADERVVRAGRVGVNASEDG
jgi:hypothetical protein